VEVRVAGEKHDGTDTQLHFVLGFGEDGTQLLPMAIGQLLVIVFCYKGDKGLVQAYNALVFAHVGRFCSWLQVDGIVESGRHSPGSQKLFFGPRELGPAHVEK